MADHHQDGDTEEEVAMMWGFLEDTLKSTPGHRSSLLLEYMRSVRAAAWAAGRSLPRDIAVDGRRFQVSADLLQCLELLPNVDALLVDLANPRLPADAPVSPASASQEVKPDRGRRVKPTQARPAQEAEVLRVLRELGHEPTKLPPRAPGKPWVKSEAWAAIGRSQLFATECVFNKAWERLRAKNEIAERPGL